jgi:hypothetical protein
MSIRRLVLATLATVVLSGTAFAGNTAVISQSNFAGSNSATLSQSSVTGANRGLIL